MRGSVLKGLVFDRVRGWLNCRLCWWITLGVFISIFIIEGAIFIPSYRNYERDQLARLENVGREVIAATYGLNGNMDIGDILLISEALTKKSSVRGGVVYGPQDEPLGGFGETPVLTLEEFRQGRSSVRSPDGKFFDVAWDRDDLDVRYSVVARLDAAAVSVNLRAFVWRIIGLITLIAVFVTAVTIMIVGWAVFSPILHLRAILQKVGDDPEHPDRYLINTSRNDEWADVVESFNVMIRRISDNMKRIKQHEEDSRAAKKEADAANRTKSQFLSNMSHELRTPLNAILGYAQFLEYHPTETLTEKQREYVGNILTAGHHLQDLINQVLDLAKIESGKATVTLEDLNAEKVIDECLGMVASSAESTGIVVRHVCGECAEPSVDRPFIRADYTRLKEVLLNLLSNAVKYNRLNGEVTVSCRETDAFMLRINVRDTGTGIPEEFHKDLFEPFSRFGPSTNSIEGTGIGLTITRQLVKLMNGKIGFDSKVGVGTTFWVELPLSTQ